MCRTIFVFYTLLISAIMLHALNGAADALTYDFEQLASGDYLESELNDLVDGVSFENTGGTYFRAFSDGFDISIGNSQDEQLIYNHARESSNKTVATFDHPTNYVSVEYDTGVPYLVEFYMRAYASDNSLLAEVSRYNDSYDPFESSSYKLEFNSILANIAYVEFWCSDANYTNNSWVDAHWDNFSFSPAPIPEPATAILLGIGLTVLFRKRKLPNSKQN